MLRWHAAPHDHYLSQASHPSGCPDGADARRDRYPVAPATSRMNHRTRRGPCPTRLRFEVMWMCPRDWWTPTVDRMQGQRSKPRGEKRRFAAGSVSGLVLRESRRAAPELQGKRCDVALPSGQSASRSLQRVPRRAGAVSLLRNGFGGQASAAAAPRAAPFSPLLDWNPAIHWMGLRLVASIKNSDMLRSMTARPSFDTSRPSFDRRTVGEASGPDALQKGSVAQGKRPRRLCVALIAFSPCWYCHHRSRRRSTL